MDGYVVLKDSTVEQIADDGDPTFGWAAPGLYEELAAAGYPTHQDEAEQWDGCLDLTVEGDSVVAHTTGEPPYEHPMGEASGLFLAWLARTA